MAGYVPAILRTPTNITASYATVVTSSGVTIMRTFAFNVLTTAHSVFLSQGIGAEATSIVQARLLSVTEPYIVNGWFVLTDTVVLQVKADSIATNAPTFGAWGYTYS